MFDRHEYTKKLNKMTRVQFYQEYTSVLNEKIDIVAKISKFSAESGKSIDEIVSEFVDNNGEATSEIDEYIINFDTLTYKLLIIKNYMRILNKGE